MADSYRITSAKDQFDGTTRVLVEGEVDSDDAKFAYVGGDPVELTEDQVETIKERFHVRTATEEQQEKAGQKSGSSSTPAKGEGGAVSVEGSPSGGGGNAGGSTSAQGAPAR